MKRKIQQITISALLAALLLSDLSAPAVSASVSQTAEETAPSGIKLTELANEVDIHMKKYIGVSAPGAVVVVIKNGEIILSRAYGDADTEKNIPMSTDTVFEYASVSKMFVWVSVMQLAEQGKLDLDADIRTYLPAEFNEKWENNYTVTMRSVMNHSSGYGEYLLDLISHDESGSTDLSEIILSSYPNQYFEPGTASAYSNYATALAAYIVECISGKEFCQYEKENIFDKLNMDMTAGHPFWNDNTAVLGKKAQGYTKKTNGQFVNTGWTHTRQYPSGSVNGTGEDLAKFLIALMPAADSDSPLFMNNETINIMLSPSFSQGGSGTSHGFFEYYSAPQQAYGHGGNSISFSAHTAFVPSEHFGLVVLTNAAGESDITYGLHELLIGSKKAAPPASIHEFPDADVFARSYADMRRPVKTAHEFISYLSLAAVTKIGTNRIRFQKGPFYAEYIQTSPYVFELDESTHPAMKIFYYRLEFKMENGIPSRILAGNGFDLSALPAHRSQSILTLNAAVLIISVLFFTVCPIALLITAIRKKKKNIISDSKTARVHNALILTGTALLANNGILLTKLSDPFALYSQFKLFAAANYILAGVSIILFVSGIISFRRLVSRTKKILFVITAAVMISFVSVLISWNMFTLYT